MDSVERINGTEGIYTMGISGTEVFWQFTSKFGICTKKNLKLFGIYTE